MRFRVALNIATDEALWAYIARRDGIPPTQGLPGPVSLGWCDLNVTRGPADAYRARVDAGQVRLDFGAVSTRMSLPGTPAVWGLASAAVCGLDGGSASAVSS
jgi:hypothetical protein